MMYYHLIPSTVYPEQMNRFSKTLFYPIAKRLKCEKAEMFSEMLVVDFRRHFHVETSIDKPRRNYGHIVK